MFNSSFKSSVAAIIGLGVLWGNGMNLAPLRAEPLLSQLSQSNNAFTVGDRLEIQRQGQWRSGQVLDRQTVNGETVYEVRYLDVGFVERGVTADRLRSSQTAPMQVQNSRPAQPQIDLQKPVYVEQNGKLREARILYAILGSGGDRYTVQFRDDGSLLENVRANQLTPLDTAQTAGLASEVYDLSTQAGIDAMLAAHNYWRSQAGVPPLTWSDELAEFAQDWAEDLAAQQKMQHNPNSDYGENLAQGSNAFLTPERVVNLWGNEVSDYNYQANRCDPGKICGHYTQLVWEETREVGCGTVRKNNGWEIWVCNYDPPGNYVGERPY